MIKNLKITLKSLGKILNMPQGCELASVRQDDTGITFTIVDSFNLICPDDGPNLCYNYEKIGSLNIINLKGTVNESELRRSNEDDNI